MKYGDGISMIWGNIDTSNTQYSKYSLPVLILIAVWDRFAFWNLIDEFRALRKKEKNTPMLIWSASLQCMVYIVNVGWGYRNRPWVDSGAGTSCDCWADCDSQPQNDTCHTWKGCPPSVPSGVSWGCRRTGSLLYKPGGKTRIRAQLTAESLQVCEVTTK